MARYNGPVCRLCRRVGEKLMIKGEPGLPGQRPKRPRKPSDHELRLREKQKARYTYGMMERQFYRFFTMAERSAGPTGENFRQLLERRLDVIVLRLGFAESRSQARQFVRHGHIAVNAHKVDIPSYLVKPGDVISWKENAKKKEPYKVALETVDTHVIPSWLSLDKQTLSGRVLTLPVSEEITAKFDLKMIVEYYSR
ncbi:MAG: 30S ribosomal protein S4 [Chloroflexi bacterium]|nr:30S ribosomal protein S4 [Chloroflexota bacterium]